MSMTVVVTRDVEDRYRGFLDSVMLEVAPGVYTSPRMSAAIRERVWKTLAEWHAALGRGSIVMTWKDTASPGGQGLRHLGQPSRTLVEADGMILVRQ